MSQIKYGFQTYTWQMSYERFSQELEHIIGVVSRAGMSGIEPEICMLGPYGEAPGKLAADLQERGVELGALCLVCDWRGPAETPDEREEADRAIEMLQTHFPGTLLAFCQMPGIDRADLAERQDNCISCITDIASRAEDAGIGVAFHPNSPEGSVFRIADDYEKLMDRLGDGAVWFAPDFGHIAKGGMDPVEVSKRYVSRIRHVHFKDMNLDGDWVEMGKGAIDFAGIVDVLKGSGYVGWIMVEDESARAEDDPDSVAMENGHYIKERFAS